MSQQNECKLNKELLGGIMELSFPRTFAPGSEITVELSLSNINVIIYVLTQ